MEDLDKLFEEIDKLNVKKETYICCNDEKNYKTTNEGIICDKCNKLISNISTNPEWKLYSNKNNAESIRCGNPINLLLPNSSIGTSISNKSNKSNSNDINKVKRYQKWNSMSYKERSRYKIFNDIKEICDKLKLTQIIINEANSLYVIVSDIKISRGSNRLGIIAACIYFACKNCKAPRSNKEISKSMNIKSTIITKGVKNLQILFNMTRSDRLNKLYTINHLDFIDRFCSKLEVNNNYIEEIKFLSINAEKYKLISDNTPPSIAAGCIYLYSLENNLQITKKNISNVSGISEVTINKCLNKLNKFI